MNITVTIIITIDIIMTVVMFITITILYLVINVNVVPIITTVRVGFCFTHISAKPVLKDEQLLQQNGRYSLLVGKQQHIVT